MFKVTLLGPKTLVYVTPNPTVLVEEILAPLHLLRADLLLCCPEGVSG